MPVRARRLGLVFLIVVLGALAASPLVFRAFPAVPSSSDAVTAAKRAWGSVYDKAPWHREFSPPNVARFEPYIATLSGGVWFVTGTVPLGSKPEDMPNARVRRWDGAVEFHLAARASNNRWRGP